MNKTFGFIFPGQGAQFVGMGKDFAESYPVARQTFEEADDLLQKHLSKVIFNGPDDVLIRTDHSQLAIYVTSIAIWRTLLSLYPHLSPAAAAGLSLGEYTAFAAAGKISFKDGLHLVGHRGDFMSEACDENEGTMAVVIGLDSDEIESMVRDLSMPHDLWAANFNCPGQVVVSGTVKGVKAAAGEAEKRGARRVLLLQVHGAFHSGLMASAKEKLKPYINSAAIQNSETKIAMNVPGDFVESIDQMRQNLIDQVTCPVRWEQEIKAMNRSGITLFIEIGPGTTLAGMNKRIGISGQTISIGQVDDLRKLEKEAII